MADAKTWGDRITEWRVSGLSAVKFTEGRDFSAHQLWNWTARFRKEATGGTTSAPAGAKQVGLRIARVVRGHRRARVVAPRSEPLSVELGGIRVVLPAGFDRATFSAVLDEIETRRARVDGR